MRWFLKEANCPGETRCKKSWDRFEEVRFTQSTLRQASIQEKKGPSLGKMQVQKSTSAKSPYAVKFEDRSHEETERQQRCVRSEAWNLAKNRYKLKEKDKATFYSSAEESGTPSCGNKRAGGKIVRGRLRSLYARGQPAKDLNSADLETMRTLRSPTTVMTADGEVQTREEAMENVKELDLLVTVICFLKKHQQFFHSGSSARIRGITYHWTSGQKPHLTKKGKRIDCNISNYVPFLVTGLSTSSSTTPLTPTSSSSSSQDSVLDVNRYTENPLPERSGSTSEELRGETRCMNPQKPKPIMKMRNQPDWLQEFKENVVDGRSPLEPRGNPEHGYRDTSSSSHESLMESRAKVEPGPGKHGVYTHFPKDPKL